VAAAVEAEKAKKVAMARSEAAMQTRLGTYNDVPHAVPDSVKLRGQPATRVPPPNGAAAAAELPPLAQNGSAVKGGQASESSPRA